MGMKWSPQEAYLVKTLLVSHSMTEIAQQINIRHSRGLPGFRTERSYESVRKKVDREGWTPETVSEEPDQVTEAWNKITALANEVASAQDVRRPGRIASEDIDLAALILSDIHFPLARVDFLNEAIDSFFDDYSKRYPNITRKVCVVNGDLVEGYIYSSFSKDKRIAAIDEYNAALNFISILSNRFDTVILVEGNHDARPARMLQRIGLDQEIINMLRPSLMHRLANGEVIDRTGLTVDRLDFSNVKFDFMESWYIKLGKTIIFHPSTMGSDKPGHTVTRIGPKLARRYNDDEVDSFVCGHTHKIYKGVENGKMYIEQGCMAGLLRYFFKSSNSSVKHYQNGYCVLFQDAEGNTDFNKSGPIYLGECLPPKKDSLS